MDQITLLENELIGKIEGLKDDIEAIQQPRSNFALENFVVKMHPTPGRQRMQAVLELQIKMFNIKRTQLSERELGVKIRQQQEISRNRSTGIIERELAEIEIERMETDLAELRLARLGNIREAQALLAILDRLPKYTYAELQAEEAEYWLARLSEQALRDSKATGTIGQGNLEAINQIFRKLGVKEESPLSPEELEAISLTHEGRPSKRLPSV